MAAVAVKTVLNRRALDAIHEGYVAGFEAMAKRVLERAQPNVPDAPPLGEGLVTEGAYGVWLDGRQVAGTATAPAGLATTGVVMAVGYPFPMRFYEEGTVHQPARPVLTPVALEVAPDADQYIAPEVRKRVGRG